MAQIRPFKAYRPCKGMEERIAALPYDVYNREEAHEVVKKNPESFLAVDRAETQFGEEVDTYADCVYEKADQMLREKILEGKFVQDPTPCFYLYELTMDGHSQTGVVGCASIDDYRNNVIKKHENTRADKEEDRIRHVDTCSMQTGPIFLAYRAKEDLKEKIGELKKQAPVYDFVSEDGIGHRVWVIDNDSDVAMIEEAFGKIPAIYIADGHHRCASAVKVGVSYVKATETPSETKFNDVSANDWFASAVDYVTGKGMMNGTADNTFSPKANTTRGMVVTVLYRLENQPSTSAASFTDVASGAYYANAVAWANANGIVSGYGSGKFGPNDKVTREQLAAILYRYAQYKKYDVSVGEDTNILSYDDAQSISSYAIPAIQWACGAGVVTGKSGSKLDPKGNATRAEVAAMLMRFCENVK